MKRFNTILLRGVQNQSCPGEWFKQKMIDQDGNVKYQWWIDGLPHMKKWLGNPDLDSSQHDLEVLGNINMNLEFRLTQDRNKYLDPSALMNKQVFDMSLSSGQLKGNIEAANETRKRRKARKTD